MASAEPAIRVSYARLLDRNARAGSFQLSLQLLGIRFGQAFLDLARYTFNQVLGFLQTQGGSLANDFDHTDLIIAEAIENDVEFGLRSRCFRSAAASWA